MRCCCVSFIVCRRSPCLASSRSQRISSALSCALSSSVSRSTATFSSISRLTRWPNLSSCTSYTLASHSWYSAKRFARLRESLLISWSSWRAAASSSSRSTPRPTMRSCSCCRPPCVKTTYSSVSSRGILRCSLRQRIWLSLSTTIVSSWLRRSCFSRWKASSSFSTLARCFLASSRRWRRLSESLRSCSIALVRSLRRSTWSRRFSRTASTASKSSSSTPVGHVSSPSSPHSSSSSSSSSSLLLLSSSSSSSSSGLRRLIFLV
mmetsp:Transcript_35258/g.108823  ORF Transcript_35258/g.108823 Transcript_35258/m.108823 type:complete len:264 (+) Transcript_35258:431-1222(+)